MHSFCSGCTQSAYIASTVALRLTVVTWHFSLQLDVETRAADAKNRLCQFSHHIVSLIVEVSRGRIRDLDAHLVAVLSLIHI